MPRSRRSAPARRAAPRSAPPAASSAAKPPAKQEKSSGGGMMAGMASTMAQGFAFGTGSSIAHRAIGAVMGDGSSSAPAEEASAEQAAVPQQTAMEPCQTHKQLFGNCLQDNNNDVGSCQFVFEQLQTCQLEAKNSYI